MQKKCEKFESLFVFSDEDTFLEHVKGCSECRLEYEKMQKVSELIQEVKPYFREKQRGFNKLKALCAVFVTCICISTLCVISVNPDISDTIMYGTTLSAEDLGLPVDSYGLLDY